MTPARPTVARAAPRGAARTRAMPDPAAQVSRVRAKRARRVQQMPALAARPERARAAAVAVFRARRAAQAEAEWAELPARQSLAEATVEERARAARAARPRLA